MKSYIIMGKGREGGPFYYRMDATDRAGAIREARAQAKRESRGSGIRFRAQRGGILDTGVFDSAGTSK